MRSQGHLLRLLQVGAVVDSPDSLRVVGVITDRDIVVRHVAREHFTDCVVAGEMTDRGIVTVRADDHSHDVMGRIRHYQVRRIPVVDEEHRLVGVISVADIAVNLGPYEPLEVERMLEAVSAPAVAAV